MNVTRHMDVAVVVAACAAMIYQTSGYHSSAAAAMGKLPCVVFRFDRAETRVAVPWAAIAAAYGGASHPDDWTETNLAGLAFLAGLWISMNDR